MKKPEFSILSFSPFLGQFFGLIFFLLPTLSGAIETAFEQDPSLPIVYLNIAIQSGSVSDPPGQAGLTNFMGEMLLRGTSSQTKKQIDLALDQMGASLEVETRLEAMIFRGAVLSSQLKPFLELLHEILCRPSFTGREIKKLKAEITSLLQEELGHDHSLTYRKFNHFLFQDHPYGKSILGQISELQQLTHTSLLSHYESLIKSSLILVLATGDTSLEQISGWSQQLEKTLSSRRTAESTPSVKLQTPQDSNHRRLLLIDKPDRTQTQIYGGQIGVHLTDPDYFPLYIGNHAFGGPSFSAILMTQIRVKRGWSYGANSSFRFGTQPRSWSFHLFPAEKNTPQALEYTLHLIENLKEKGITAAQFEFAKESLIKSSGFMYNTPRLRIENKLLEKTLNLPQGFMQSYATELKKIQLSQVNAALKKFLKPDQMAIAVLGTAKNLTESLTRSTQLSPDKIQVVSYTSD